MNIHLGYEIHTGKAVAIPLRHQAVTGITQRSGKTTTMEALIQRAGVRAVAFITKRGEKSFAGCPIIPPYFRQRADWQFVSSILEAALHEKLHLERTTIMNVCRDAKTLQEVEQNIERGLETVRAGTFNEAMYIRLQEYLKLVLPQIEKLPYQNTVKLARGINVMDLRDYSTDLQSLVIHSVMEWVYEKETNCVVIVPEAPDFIPRQYASPVKRMAEKLIRKSGGLENFLWIDSQDIAGVSREVLRQVTVYIMGVQRDEHEIERGLKHIPTETLGRKPKADDLTSLGVGQFIACYDDQVRRVYVQPHWMSNEMAEILARTNQRPSAALINARKDEEEKMWQEKYETAQQEIARLTETVRQLRDDLKAEKENRKSKIENRPSALAALPEQARNQAVPGQAVMPPSVIPAKAGIQFDDELSGLPWLPRDHADAFYRFIRDRAMRDPQVLCILAQQPEILVKLERPTVNLDGNTLRGGLARMIHDGFFKEAKNGNSSFVELKRRGVAVAKPNVYRELDKLAEMGFLTKEATGYQAVADMKCRIVNAE